MDLNEATKMCRRLMDDHQLHHVPLSVRSMKRTLGVTKFAKYTYMGEWRKGKIYEIALSREFILHNDVAAVKDTILHEIAHALDLAMGHGPSWRRIARQIGATPKACADPGTVVMPEGAWKGECPQGHFYHQHRAPLRVKACSRCAPVFNVENVLTWTKNGSKVDLAEMPERYRSEYHRMEFRYSRTLHQQRNASCLSSTV